MSYKKLVECKIKDFADHCMSWYRETGEVPVEMMDLYREGSYLTALDMFATLHSFYDYRFKMYHFGGTGTVQECFNHFNDLRKKAPKLKLADQLYESGFDDVDLAMLSDEVAMLSDEDPRLVEWLKGVKVFRRGFWALDVLRTRL